MNDAPLYLCICMIVIGIFLGVYMSKKTHQSEAIEKGYALYCPDTGDFAWIGECENE